MQKSEQYIEVAAQTVKMPDEKIERLLEFLEADGDPEFVKFATWMRKRKV